MSDTNQPQMFEWPELKDMVLPRNKENAPMHPIMQVLALAATPWALKDIWVVLRMSGVPIETRAEPEVAVAVFYCLGLALKHGEDWDKVLTEDMNRMIKELQTKKAGNLNDAEA